MCAEAFQQQPKKTKTVKASPVKEKKRAKRYNTPILSVRCDNCDKQAIRLKLIKKLTTCNETDLIKFDKFWGGLRSENVLMSTLPPADQIDTQLYSDLLTVIQKREQDDFDFINNVLPTHVDRIKTAWYESPYVTTSIFNVPNTESDASM